MFAKTAPVPSINQKPRRHSKRKNKRVSKIGPIYKWVPKSEDKNEVTQPSANKSKPKYEWISKITKKETAKPNYQ